MKNRIKYLLQRLLGFRTYLYVFALFKIKTLRRDKKERDFFLFLDQVKPGGVILDIGANIGIMTYHLSRRFQDSDIVAFEPVPMNFATLEKVVKRYKLDNVDLQPMALGTEDGEVEMVIPVEGKARQQGLSHVMHESITEFNEGEKLRVPIHRLDSLPVGKNGRAVTGIKMDVENFEFFVLDGGRALLEKHHPVIYTELWENENRDHCFALARELGYEVKVACQGKLVTYDPATHRVQNFIFTPR